MLVAFLLQETHADGHSRDAGAGLGESEIRRRVATAANNDEVERAVAQSIALTGQVGRVVLLGEVGVPGDLVVGSGCSACGWSTPCD